MDIVELGCALLRERWIEWLMKSSGYLGHAVPAGIIGALLWSYGHKQADLNYKQIGTALLVGLAVVTGLVEGINRLFLLLGLQPFGVAANVSIQAACAFVLAAVLATGFPIIRSVVFLFAMLAALSRLYTHGSPVAGIIAGSILGVAVGVISARYFVTERKSRLPGVTDLAFGLTTAAVASSLFFFYALEREVRSSMVDEKLLVAAPLLTLDFGTAQARPLLRHGWSGDEVWSQGKRSVIWATGLGSEMILNLPAVQNVNFRLHLLPYGGKGPSCQQVQIQVNDTRVSQIRLKHGWHSYQVAVPRSALKLSNNSVQFFFDYAESPKARTGAADDRFLSVAFDRLEIFPGG
jgi:hypothetical protein